jgi:hypothetical protein
MKDFVLGFPLPFASEQIWPWMIHNEWIPSAPGDSELHLKGIHINFTPHLQNAHAELPQIFSEHNPLDDAEKKDILSHQSILFLVGRFKDRAGFLAVQDTISLLLQGGALGVVLEHCGAAFTKVAWNEEHSGQSMSGWLNWIMAKGDLRTLGMECFSLPDLVIPVADSLAADPKQTMLLELAESQFLDGVQMDSGHHVESEDGLEYVLRMEAKGPYPKGHPNFNTKGAMRLATVKSV